MPMKTLLTGMTALTLLTAACSREPEPGEMSAEQEQGLNEAADMLDASPDSLAAEENVMLGNGEEAQTGDVMVADEAIRNVE
jgi:hypothetical protein